MAERDAAFGRLQRSGVDALAVHELEELARLLRKLPRRKWPADRSARDDRRAASKSNL
jgi:hypothetical protein